MPRMQTDDDDDDAEDWIRHDTTQCEKQVQQARQQTKQMDRRDRERRRRGTVDNVVEKRA
jgi:hypothetical protein